MTLCPIISFPYCCNENYQKTFLNVLEPAFYNIEDKQRLEILVLYAPMPHSIYHDMKIIPDGLLLTTGVKPWR